MAAAGGAEASVQFYIVLQGRSVPHKCTIGLIAIILDQPELGNSSQIELAVNQTHMKAAVESPCGAKRENVEAERKGCDAKAPASAPSNAKQCV